VDLCWISNLVR